MAGSIGDRHKPENSQPEQRREDRSPWRPRQGRHPSKPMSKPDVILPMSPRPQESLGRTRLRFIKRGLQAKPLQEAPTPAKPIPLRPGRIRQTERRPSQPDRDIRSQFSQLRGTRGRSLGSASDPRPSRKRLSVSHRPMSQSLKLATDKRRDREFPTSQPSPSPRTRRNRRSQKRPSGFFVYVVRLLILGVGIGAIAGTLLSAFDPASQLSVTANDNTQSQVQENSTTATSSPGLPLRQEIPTLKAQIQSLGTQNPNLQPGAFILDLDTGAYVDWNGGSIFPAASTIKVPILVAFFQDVDAGKIRLDEFLTLEPEMIGTGSGDLQYKQLGSQYTALEVVTKMNVISDNTATNMIIQRLGGAQALNERFRAWGLNSTVINNPLPDLEGTNTTSPTDLATLMSMVNQGELLSLRSRDRVLDIMQRTVNNSLLPRGLGSGATIAHKTGDIGSLIADVGLVDMPTGKRYIIVAMVKRPHNDASASELIRKISRTVYDSFNQPYATPTTTSMPVQSPPIVSRGILPERSVLNLD